MKLLKKYIALGVICAVLIAGAAAIPEAVEASVPVYDTIHPKTVSFAETVHANGSLKYIGQSEVTAALPLVISSFNVEEGDNVSVGDVIAYVDRSASEAFIAGLGNMPQLAVAATSLSAAMSLIPTEITADRNGKIISVAGNGAAVEAGNSIASIAGTNSMVLSAAVSELDISKIYLGQPVKFICSAYPDEEFSGTVARIAAAARSHYAGAVLETVIDVLITPDTTDSRLKSGLSAEVIFQLADPRQICVLPYEAIGQDNEGEYIYILENGAAVKHKIFTGAEFSDGTEIIKGVNNSDKVFLNPEKIAQSRYVRISR